MSTPDSAAFARIDDAKRRHAEAAKACKHWSVDGVGHDDEPCCKALIKAALALKQARVDASASLNRTNLNRRKE